MRCVVFSNFGGDFFDRTIRPKLEALGLELVKVVLPGRESDFSAEYDLLVGFQDMTVKSQREAMRVASRKHGKPSIFLSRSNPSWEKELSDKIPGLAAKGAPPAAEPVRPQEKSIPKVAGVPKDRIGPLVTEYARAVDAGEDATGAFEEALGRPPGEGEPEAVIEAIRSSGECPAFFAEWLRSREPEPEPEPASDPEMFSLYAEENASLRAEVAALREQIAGLEAKVSIPAPVPGGMSVHAELESIKQEISAVRELRECGSMSDQEALRALLAIAAGT